MTTPIHIIDPRKIRMKNLPCVVFVDNMQGFISWRIKAHSKGNYSHVMWMVEPGVLLSHDMGHGFRKVDLFTYMKPYIRMKFVQPLLTQAEINALHAHHAAKLARGEGYDLLGIVGQRLGLKWLQNKRKSFCSEGVSADFRAMGHPIKFGAAPTPSEINNIMKLNPGYFKVIGIWQEE